MSETVLREETRAWADYLGWWIVGGLLLLFFGLGILVFLGIWLDRKQRKYTITSERVITRFGLIGRKVSEVELKNIQDVELRQGILQRLVGTGTLGFSSAGRAGVEVTFEGVSDPEGVKELVRRRTKAQAGVQ